MSYRPAISINKQTFSQLHIRVCVCVRLCIGVSVCVGALLAISVTVINLFLAVHRLRFPFASGSTFCESYAG